MRRLSYSWTAPCALFSLCLFAGCGRFLHPDVQAHIEAPFPQKLSGVAFVYRAFAFTKTQSRRDSVRSEHAFIF